MTELTDERLREIAERGECDCRLCDGSCQRGLARALLAAREEIARLTRERDEARADSITANGCAASSVSAELIHIQRAEHAEAEVARLTREAALDEAGEQAAGASVQMPSDQASLCPPGGPGYQREDAPATSEPAPQFTYSADGKPIDPDAERKVAEYLEAHPEHRGAMVSREPAPKCGTCGPPNGDGRGGVLAFDPETGPTTEPCPDCGGAS